MQTAKALVILASLVGLSRVESKPLAGSDPPFLGHSQVERPHQRSGTAGAVLDEGRTAEYLRGSDGRVRRRDQTRPAASHAMRAGKRTSPQEPAIHIRPDQRQGTLNHKVFGAGIDWRSRGDYLWTYDGTHNELNHRLVAKASELRLPVLRLHSGGWLWKVHIGDQRERALSTPRWIEGYDDPDDYGPRVYGPLEFMKSCEVLDTEPILVVNVGRDYCGRTKENGGLAQDAADLLEYLNGFVTPALKAVAKRDNWQENWYKGTVDRAGRCDYGPVPEVPRGYYAWLRWQHLGGRHGIGEQGYNVRYWEIGNEIYFGYMKPWAASCDPAGFAQVMNAFADSLRERQTDLRADGLYPSGFAAECGAPVPTWEWPCADWMDLAFQRISPGIDFVVPHVYYAPPSGGCSDWKGIRTRSWSKDQQKECVPIYLRSGRTYCFQLQLVCRNWDLKVEIRGPSTDDAWRTIYDERSTTSNWDVKAFNYSASRTGQHQLRVHGRMGSDGGSSNLQVRMFRFKADDEDWSWPHQCAALPDKQPYMWSNDPQLIKFNPSMDIARAYFAAPEAFVRKKIEWVRSKVGRRKVLITEVNTTFDIEAVDMKSALFLADVIRVFLEDGVEGAAFWNLADYCHNTWFALIDSGEAAERYNNRGWHLDGDAHLAKDRPSFLLYRMLGDYFRQGTHLVRTEVVNGPTFAMPADENPDTPAWTGPFNSLAALTSMADDKLYLLVINKSAEVRVDIVVRDPKRTVVSGVAHVLHTDPASAAVKNGGMAVEATNENYYGRTINSPNVVVSRERLACAGSKFPCVLKPYSVTILELTCCSR